MKMAIAWIAILLAFPYFKCICLECENSFYTFCGNCDESSPSHYDGHICLDDIDYYSPSSNEVDFQIIAPCFYQKQNCFANSEKPISCPFKNSQSFYRSSRKSIILFQVIQV